MTFIIRAISSLAFIGSSRLTPYWFIAVVRTSAAATPSPPISLLVVAILFPIACNASGYLPSSGDNCESRSLYPSTACEASMPKALALSRAYPSILSRVLPVTPAMALRSCIWLSRSMPDCTRLDMALLAFSIYSLINPNAAKRCSHALNPARAVSTFALKRPVLSVMSSMTVVKLPPTLN